MNARHRLLSLLILLPCFFLIPDRLLACACCALDDQYSIYASSSGSYELSLLEEMRFADSAGLVVGPEETEPWLLRGGMRGREWKLSLSNNSGSGTLMLAMPARTTSFKADIHDGVKSAGGGPLLYKEWRIEGKATGSMMFSYGRFTPTKFTLIFQGRGNNCDASEDFTHWRLEIKGRKDSYVFIGRTGGAR